MNVMDVIKKRCSVRSYQDRAVEAIVVKVDLY